MTGIEAPNGSASTGDWVANGTVFYLQDASDGDSSGAAKTLAQVAVQTRGGTAANRSPTRAVLFYATDDERAAATAERLITAAGFDPVKVGGVEDAGRIEVPGGDLHENGGLGGKLLDADEARAVI